jgi:hypothetical protein
MDDPFLFLAFLIPILAALTSVVSTIYSLVQKKQVAQKALQDASQMEFERALESNDIIVLGDYLYNKLGAFRVADYAFDTKVKKRVTQFLDRLEEFLGEKSDVIYYPPYPPEPRFSIRISHPSELQRAQTELVSGRVWSALLLIRQEIEKKLSRLASEYPDTLPHKIGASALLNRLARVGLVSQDAVLYLQYAINVANRGIHGTDIATNEAEEALRSAALGMALLNRREPNQQ